MAGQAYRFFGDLFRNAADLEDNTAWFDNCDIVIDRAFTATHAGLGWLGGDRLIWEYANPDFTTALHKSGDRDTRGLDLTRLQPARLQGLYPELSKVELVAPRRHSAPLTPML